MTVGVDWSCVERTYNRLGVGKGSRCIVGNRVLMIEILVLVLLINWLCYDNRLINLRGYPTVVMLALLIVYSPRIHSTFFSPVLDVGLDVNTMVEGDSRSRSHTSS